MQGALGDLQRYLIILMILELTLGHCVLLCSGEEEKSEKERTKKVKTSKEMNCLRVQIVFDRRALCLLWCVRVCLNWWCVLLVNLVSESCGHTSR